MELYRFLGFLHQGGWGVVAVARNLETGAREVLVGPAGALLLGDAGFFLAATEEELHPKWGRRRRVLSARPLALEELLQSASFAKVARRSLRGALEILLEEGHTAYPLRLLEEATGLPLEALKSRAPEGVRIQGPLAGLEEAYQVERSILNLLAQRNQRGRGLLPPQGHRLSPTQAEIFQVLARGRVVYMAGGPGTGKSYTVATLLASPSLAGKRVGLAAPTGKAAKRLEELSGKPAQTVHRLLGAYVDEEGELRLRHHALNPLPHDFVVVDESSMLDSPTFKALLEAVSPEATLLLVGDPNQLPPVGPGEPFEDVMRFLPGLHLREVRRQAKDNPLVQAASLILEGNEPAVRDPEGRFAVAVRELGGEAMAHLAVRSYLRLRERHGEVALLTATNTGPVGVHSLNRALQARLNPRGPGLPVSGGLLAREGDPLVMTKNDYSLGLNNGEIVKVTHVDLKERALGVVARDGRSFWIQEPVLGLLLHAYAMTVHRSQGSEWPVVLVVLHHHQAALLSRELLYTAITRAKERAYLLTTPAALYAARARRASERYTWLKN